MSDTPTQTEPVINPPADSPDELTKARQQAEEYLNGWKRAKADYLNFKKQSERETEALVGFATAALILEFIRHKTNLDRAWQHLPDQFKAEPWLKGLAQVKTEYDDSLTALGVELIPTDGQPFNPELHEAVKREAKPGVAEGTVTETLEPGYRLRGQVILPAKVAVSAGAAPIPADNDNSKPTKGGDGDNGDH